MSTFMFNRCTQRPDSHANTTTLLDVYGPRSIKARLVNDITHAWRHTTVLISRSFLEQQNLIL